MSRFDVISLLKEALKRQHFDHENFQMARAEIAGYLKSRYTWGNEEEDCESKFREQGHVNIMQRINEKKEMNSPQRKETDLNPSEKPMSLLQTLLRKREQREKEQKLKDENQVVLRPLRRMLNTEMEYEDDRQLAFPKKHASLDNISLPKNKVVQPGENIIGKRNKIQTEEVSWFDDSSVSNYKVNSPTQKLSFKKIPSNINRNTKLSALGESTLRAVKDRKERKERALAIAKMEARQAKIDELRARAEAALYRAKEALQGAG